MNEKYCTKDWWIKEINILCKKKIKKEPRYKKSYKLFIILLFIAIIVVSSGVFIGISCDLILKNEIISSILDKINRLIIYIGGLITGFAINKYRNITKILNEYSHYRVNISEKIIKNLFEKKIINGVQFDNCKKYISNGASHISSPTQDGIRALNDIIENIIKEIC
ncbi:MAG: hypothetical protein ACTSPY_05860 [Candidatus Helarchaeota archaeon]